MCDHAFTDYPEGCACITLRTTNERGMHTALVTLFIHTQRFSNDEFTLEEYNEFMEQFHDILKCLLKYRETQKLLHSKASSRKYHPSADHDESKDTSIIGDT
jgi:hypothetical protein